MVNTDIIYDSFRVVFCTLAIFGNSLTIIAVTKFRVLQTPTNCILVSLAFGDAINVMELIFTLFIDFQSVINSTSVVWYAICSFKETLDIILTANNIAMIFWIAVDRYIAIRFPLRYSMLVTKQRAGAAILFSWIFEIIYIGGLVGTTNTLRQVGDCKFSALMASWVTYYCFLPFFGIITSAFMSLYLCIGFIACRSVRVSPTGSLEPEQVKRIGQRKILKMLMTVVGIFFALYIPSIIVYALQDEQEYWDYVELFTDILWRCNIWINPVIYSWHDKNFKHAFKKLLGVKTNQVNSNYSSVTND